MTGTITKYKRKNGRQSWGYWFHAGWDETGKRIQKTKSGFDTRDEARKALDAAIEEFQNRFGSGPTAQTRDMRAVSEYLTEILRAVEGSAVEAALQAAERAANQEQTRMQAVSLELEQARYQARLAERRYESADPENRLVTGELEARWNATLRHVADLENAFRTVESEVHATPIPDQSSLMRLAADLESVWHAPGTDLRLKQRIMRTLIEEIVVDVDQPTNQVVMLIHWSGGRHTELRITKPKTGEHGHKTAAEAVEVVKQMAGQYPDDVIASTLNRLGFSTGYDNTWKKHSVCSLRSKLGLPTYRSEHHTGTGHTHRRTSCRATRREYANSAGTAPHECAGGSSSGQVCALADSNRSAKRHSRCRSCPAHPRWHAFAHAADP